GATLIYPDKIFITSCPVESKPNVSHSCNFQQLIVFRLVINDGEISVMLSAVMQCKRPVPWRGHVDKLMT
ncbi:hypothetical protein M9458_016991, partial [Cirrhinus mrigala]